MGAGIMRELSLRGDESLLIEKGDFSSQTSESSSKMLHGGIRYLENFDFALVREALKEKNLWSDLAPKLTEEKMFSIPVYKTSKWSLFFVRIGLFLYDLLSGFQNPKRRVLNKKQTLEHLPGLKADGLTGAGVYSDAVVEDSKLALECIYDSLSDINHAISHTEVVEANRIGAEWSIKAKNLLSGQELSFTSKHLLISAGPFTDQLMKKLEIEWEPKMILSKGSHLWLKEDAINIENPLVLQTKDNRVIFVIPQRGAILVGTTEEALDPDFDIFDIKASQKEIDYLLEAINQYFPNHNITDKHILSTFAGVRPLVAQKDKSRGKVSRTHKIFKPQDNLYVVIGGKYTTFRIMAQDVVKRLYKDLGKHFKKDLSAKAFKRHSKFGMNPPTEVSEKDLIEVINSEMPKTYEDVVKRRLSVVGEAPNGASKENIDRLLKENH